MMQALTGDYTKHPLYPKYLQMMQGKTPQEQQQTLMNFASSLGVDLNSTRISSEEYQQFLNGRK